MGLTMIEKILSAHADGEVHAGDVAEIRIDTRGARDFGGANVVKNIRENDLPIASPQNTIFTFDCYPGATDARYATNQQICRVFAHALGIPVSDINRGIGTHIVIDEGKVVCGETFVSTDSHANILGAIGAFGQGMGDMDIAHAFAYGTVWFRVPETVRVKLVGTPSPQAAPKDVVLAMLRKLGSAGLLGKAAEIEGPYADGLGLSGRITISSMATEMGAIVAFFRPNEAVIEHCSRARDSRVEPVLPDPDAQYAGTIEIDIDGLEPQIARPGHPDDVVDVADVEGTRIHSAFIGSCTNGRYEDMVAAAEVLRGRKVAEGVVLKIVPSTDEVWKRCLKEGIMEVFKEAGALVSNAGCAGCAAGQVGQNGPGEVTVSTGNRNFPGKQGKGEVYLASPAVAAASAVAGAICRPEMLGKVEPGPAEGEEAVLELAGKPAAATIERALGERPEVIEGRVWVIRRDSIDTDMIFHNRYLAVTDIAEMGKYTFDNLPGWEDFARKAQPGDIVVTGANFGAGSSRQQAVDCFKSLGISLIIAKSFGAIYERNAINAALAIMRADLVDTDIETGERIRVDIRTGTIERIRTGKVIQGEPFTPVQLEIYRRGGLLVRK